MFVLTLCDTLVYMSGKGYLYYPLHYAVVHENGKG